RGIGWNFRRTTHGAVADVAGNDELTFAANLHRRQTFFKTLDQTTGAELKIRGRFPGGTIKRGSVFKCPGVIDDQRLPWSGTRSIAYFEIHVLQTRIRYDFRSRRIRAPCDDIDHRSTGKRKDQCDHTDTHVLITSVLGLRAWPGWRVGIVHSLARPCDFSMATLWHGASYTDIIAAVQVRSIDADRC